MRASSSSCRAIAALVMWLLRPVPAQAMQAEQAPDLSAPPPPILYQVPPPRPRVQRRPRVAWPRVMVAADLRFSGLMGDSRLVAPELGWGFGLSLSASLVPAGAMRFGFILDFEQDRFSREFMQLPMQPQLLTHSTFAAQALLDLPTRWVRPYVAGGLGLSVAHHQSPLINMDSLTPTDESYTIPLFRVSLGLGVTPIPALEIGLRVDINLTVSDQTGGVAQVGDMLEPGTLALLSPGWWSLALQVGYRFY